MDFLKVAAAIRDYQTLTKQAQFESYLRYPAPVNQGIAPAYRWLGSLAALGGLGGLAYSNRDAIAQYLGQGASASTPAVLTQAQMAARAAARKLMEKKQQIGSSMASNAAEASAAMTPTWGDSILNLWDGVSGGASKAYQDYGEGKLSIRGDNSPAVAKPYEHMLAGNTAGRHITSAIDALTGYLNKIPEAPSVLSNAGQSAGRQLSPVVDQVSELLLNLIPSVPNRLDMFDPTEMDFDKALEGFEVPRSTGLSIPNRFADVMNHIKSLGVTNK